MKDNEDLEVVACDETSDHFFDGLDGETQEELSNGKGEEENE